MSGANYWFIAPLQFELSGEAIILTLASYQFDLRDINIVHRFKRCLAARHVAEQSRWRLMVQRATTIHNCVESVLFCITRVANLTFAIPSTEFKIAI